MIFDLRSSCWDLLSILLGPLLLASAAHTVAADAPQTFRLTSPAFSDGAMLAESTVLNDLDCHGRNRSPALEWENIPPDAKSFVLICDDYEARGGDGFIHWAVYNVPATVHAFADNAGAGDPDVTGGGRHAFNDFLRRRYDGPCPPEGPPHKYRFTVFALSAPTIDDVLCRAGAIRDSRIAFFAGVVRNRRMAEMTTMANPGNG